MASSEIRYPRELAYDKKYEEDYNSLTGRGENPVKDSPFFNRTNRDIFLYAMALGFFYKKRVPLKSRRENIRWDALKQEGEWLLYSVALSEEDTLQVLLDLKKAALIAEEYANGGFPILKDIMRPERMGDPDKRMESEIRNVLKSIKDIDGADTKIEIDTLDPAATTQGSNQEEGMAIIEKLENKLRSMIITKLTSVSENWINDRVPNPQPNGIVDRWQKNRDRNARGRKLFRKGESDIHLIYYSELSDLYEIIKWTKNWKDIFEPIFQDKKVFESDMEQLLAIRPDIAHSRSLNDVQMAKLKSISLHFDRLIDQE